MGPFFLRELYTSFSSWLMDLRVINCSGTFQFGLEETPSHQTHKGGLPICGSNWNMRAMIIFPSPSAVERKGSHPNKSVTSPQCIHLLYTQWLSLWCGLWFSCKKIDCFLWLQLGISSSHRLIDCMSKPNNTFSEKLSYSYSQGLWSSFDLITGAW